ncbi:MAG: fibronectin type III domain-containing protein [Bacteroidales bacterium]|nr:fibronectin type III domain-containing protein [Bacteroidales bacterium]
MKKITLLKTLAITLFLLMGVGNAWGQGSESFSNLPTSNSSSYQSREWTGDDDVTWTANGARTDQTITGNAICWGNSGTRNVISPTYSGGIGVLSFNYVRAFTGTNNRSLEVYVNSTKIGETITVSPTSDVVITFTEIINESGDIVLEIRSTGAAQVKVDDITWTSYSGSPDPEPTNHPTDFTATANSTSQITLEWSDNDGEQVASGFLIVGKTGAGSFFEPADGNDPADDTDWTDGDFNVKVPHGTQTYEVIDLEANTQYDFKIYAYTNSGSDIDFKKDGTIPSDNATTYEQLGIPTATAATSITNESFTANWNTTSGATNYRLDVSAYEDFAEAGGDATDLFITEYVDGASGNNKAIEIYNGTGTSVDLSDYKIWLISNGGSWPESEIELSGSLSNDDVFLVIHSSADFSNLTNVDDLQNGSLSFNGNDAVGLAKDISGVWTLIDAIGTDGADPGSGWEVAGIANATADRVLTRKSSISSPNTDWDASRGTNADDSEWIVQSGGTNDDASGFGSHTFSGGSSPSFLTDYENLEVNGTSQSVSGLDPNTTYYYRVRATNGSETSENSNTIEVTTNKDAETVSGEVLFSELVNVGEGTVVTVSSGNLTIDAEASIEDLVVEAGATIDVNPEIGLLINGDLHLKSPSGNGAAASFIDKGTTLVGGNYIIERHLDAYTSAEDGWHLLAFPFEEDMAIAGSDFAPVEGDDDLYGWDEPAFTWLNYFQDNPVNFQAGKGYLVAYKTSASMRDFTADGNTYPHISDDLVLIDNASRTNDGGWHLVGNSFLSAVTWDTDNLDWLADNIEPSAQVLDVNQSGNYLAIDKGETIQALQGFFVRVTADGDNSLFLPENARTHSSGTFAKASVQNALEMKVTNDVNGYFDKTKIKIQEGASQAYDAKFDGSKLKGFTSAPQLYTVTSDAKELAVNAISNNDNEVQIPLHFEARFDASYTIKVEDNTLPEGVAVYMTDLVLNKEINLNDSPTYTFTASEGDNPNRFLLHFGAVGLDENANQSSLRAYTHHNTLYVQNSLRDAAIRVIDIQGRLLLEQKLNGTGLHKLPLDFPAGVYMVQLLNSKEHKSVKVIVE